MKAFYTTGLANEKLVLAEVKPCPWREGYSDWVYETYPQCYKRVKMLGEIDIRHLPERHKFFINNSIIGSLPGVHQVYEATEEDVKIFLETAEKIDRERQEQQEKIMQEAEIRKLQREELQKQFSIIKTYKLQHPKGGETDGQDGYFDADLQAPTGEIIRMVARNVFDFGYYCYPKRVEGSDAVFKQENWTESEKQANRWLHEFSPFTTGIRM